MLKLKENFSEVIKTASWVIGLYYQISPLLITVYIISTSLLGLTNLVNAYILAIVTDLAIELFNRGSAQISDFVSIIALILATQLLTSLLAIVSNHSIRIVDWEDSMWLKHHLHNHLKNLGISNLENSEIANKSQRFQEDVNMMMAFLQMLVSLFTNTVAFFVSAAILAKSIPLMIPIFVFISLIQWVKNQNYLRKLWIMQKETTEERRKSLMNLDLLADSVALKELIITGGHKYLNMKFKGYYQFVTNRVKDIRKKWAVFNVFNSILDSVGMGMALIFVLQKLISGVITVGRLTFEFRSVRIFADSLGKMMSDIVSLNENSTRLADARELFENYIPDVDGNKKLQPGKFTPKIEFKSVSFNYPNSHKNVIENLSLTISPGEKVAIIGENGAGKSTLIKLLCRFYRVNNGQILVDGNNINSLKISSFYKKIGVLFQEFNTYGHLSVKENIEIGHVGKVSNEKNISHSLQKADALNFVQEYPDGFEQILNEKFKGGTRPSTGQWQKLAIARFFYRDAPVLILDEPTASIDAVAEAQIFDNIYKFIKNKTVIIISHRFSTVRNADRIIVLDKGKIIEDGSHEELLKKGGKYAKAFELQAKGYS